jgi:hypothetical protein
MFSRRAARACAASPWRCRRWWRWCARASPFARAATAGFARAQGATSTHLPPPQSCIRSVSASALCDAAKPALGACHASVSSQACCGALRLRFPLLMHQATERHLIARPPMSPHDRRASGLERGLLPLPRHAVVLHGALRLAACCLACFAHEPCAASFSSHCAFTFQSSLLSSFQQILTACGGTPITGSACPVSTPGAAPPSAPPAPAVTSVTAVWAYAVLVDASTIAVRR